MVSGNQIWVDRLRARAEELSRLSKDETQPFSVRLKAMDDSSRARLIAGRVMSKDPLWKIASKGIRAMTRNELAKEKLIL